MSCKKRMRRDSSREILEWRASHDSSSGEKELMWRLQKLFWMPSSCKVGSTSSSRRLETSAEVAATYPCHAETRDHEHGILDAFHLVDSGCEFLTGGTISWRLFHLCVPLMRHLYCTITRGAKSRMNALKRFQTAPTHVSQTLRTHHVWFGNRYSNFF